MSGYEEEHNITAEQRAEQTRRRPDLATFFSTLDFVDTSGNRQPQNAHSLPLPQDISSAFRTLANAFDMMRSGESSATDSHSELLDRLVESLMDSAEHPPSEVQGVSDEFIEQLERVPKKELKPDHSCPICANPFLDGMGPRSSHFISDSHPLVVRLPCHRDHIFDLECIQPWLKLNPTCPLDRKSLIKKKAPPPPPTEEEADFDDMYA